MPYRTPGRPVIRRYEPTPEELYEALTTYLTDVKDIPISHGDEVEFEWRQGNESWSERQPALRITWDDAQ